MATPGSENTCQICIYYGGEIFGNEGELGYYCQLTDKTGGNKACPMFFHFSDAVEIIEASRRKV